MDEQNAENPRWQKRDPVVRAKPHSYQPSKAELEEPVKVDATPQRLALAAVTPVRVVEDQLDKR